jgi:hypothetical protein
LPNVALATTAATWVQIALGAQLRHVPHGLALGPFALWVCLHVIAAVVLLIGVSGIVAIVRWKARQDRFLVRLAWLLTGLFIIQLALGAATWVTNYGWPLWFTRYVWQISYTVVAAGPLQAVTTTAHVAVGSLVLGTALVVAIWSRRG